MARKPIWVSGEAHRVFKEHVKRLYGHAWGVLGHAAEHALLEWAAGEKLGTAYIHKKSVAGQATLNPGLVIPELLGVNGRRTRTIVKVLEHLTKGGKFVNECEVNEPLLRNIAKQYTSNYYSIRAVAHGIMENLTEERGGKRFLKLGVSERIREAMGGQRG